MEGFEHAYDDDLTDRKVKLTSKCNAKVDILTSTQNPQFRYTI
jgi:hypothetical protein